ncbi:MAG: sensor domain-containing phosphodiesterase [Stenotrophobium sp.]
MNGLPGKDAGLTAASAANSVLVVVSESENIGKRIESHLRNTGYPVRAHWVSSLDALEEVLNHSTPQLLMCSDGMTAAPLKEVVGMGMRLSPQLPILSLARRYTAEGTLDALAAGARDQVSCEDARHLRHLQMVCLRELASQHNVRSLETAHIRLNDYEARQKQLLTGSTDALAHAQEGILCDVNPAFANLLGYDNPDDLVGMPLMDIISPDFQGRVKEYLKLLHKGKTDDKPLECGFVQRDGMPSNASVEFSRSSVNGEIQIGMLVRATVAHTGGGSSTSGRMLFLDALTATLKNAQPPHNLIHAAMCISVDDYSSVEQRLGFHDAEEAIARMMEWIRARLSSKDHLFRFSTNELAAIISRPNAGDFEPLGELLCRECAKQIFATRGHEAQISISISLYPLAGDEQSEALLSELVRTARMLSAQGGRRTQVLGPTAKSSAVEREEARRAAVVKKAHDANRLRLALQSIASLEGETRQHHDVLLRLVEENGHEMQAAEFRPAAEKFGLMPALDRWVTASVLALLAKTTSSDEPSSLFIKLSEGTLKDAEGFLAWLSDALKARPLKPGELVFEFQELRLQNHIRKAKTLTTGLRELGAAISIDQFGTGANSGQLLDHIPSSYLKFNPSFTQQFNDKDMFKKMSSLMEIAQQHKVKTIVCHVEDANVMARLWQMGVNYIQGYQLQEPSAVMPHTEPGARDLSAR